MDLYQGSLPRKFISFRLGTTPTKSQMPEPNPSSSAAPNPTEPPVQFCSKKSDYDSDASSSCDVTEYADKMADKLTNEDQENEIESGSEANPATEDKSSHSGQDSNVVDPNVETIPGTSVPLIPHHIVITTSGPGQNGVQLEFPPTNSPQDVAQFRQDALKNSESFEKEQETVVNTSLERSKESEAALILIGEESRQEDDTTSSIVDAPPLPIEKEIKYPDTDESGHESHVEAKQPEEKKTTSAEDTFLQVRNPRNFLSGVPSSGELSEAELEMRPAIDPLEPREISGKSRLLLKRYFSETTPLSLPVGHPTIALNEGQMHHLVRVITDETIDTSFNLLRGVLKEHRDNVLLNPQVVRPKPLRVRDRALTPHRNAVDTSEDEASQNKQTASYVSGAINGPADLSGSEFYLETTTDEGESSGEMAVKRPKLSQRVLPQASSNAGPSRSAPTTPTDQVAVASPYSSQDNQPLASLIREVAAETGNEGDTEQEESRTPKKRVRRKVASKPKAPITMTEAMFKKIRWMRAFISGPPDPVSNPHTVWCHICQKSLSIASRGSREIVRHHKGITHLRLYQRWA